MTTKDMTTTQASELDARDTAKLAESLVTRGDISGLTPQERARYYVQMCDGLGLNPTAQPFAFLKLNGKEVMYATRGATDQLARIHNVTREIVEGPKVIDLAGTKLVYAVAKATLPSGRTETSTATVPLQDPANVLMKCETKAKRRVTMSILGMSILDETELETIPAAVKGEAVGLSPREEGPMPPDPLAGFSTGLAEVATLGELVSLWRASQFGTSQAALAGKARTLVDAHLARLGYALTGEDVQTVLAGNMPGDVAILMDTLARAAGAGDIDRAWEAYQAVSGDAPAHEVERARKAVERKADALHCGPSAKAESALDAFLARVPEIDLPGEAVPLWIDSRVSLAICTQEQREMAWKAIRSRVEVVGKMTTRGAAVWLKKACADEGARRGIKPPEDDPTPPTGTDAPRGTGSASDAHGTATPATAGSGPAAVHRAHLAGKGSLREVVNSLLAHPDWPGYREACADRVAALLACDDQTALATLDQAVRDETARRERRAAEANREAA